MPCPSFEIILDSHDGRAGAAEAGALAEHLNAGCARCAADVAWYARLRAVVDSDDSVAPPQWVVRRAVRIFETRRPRSLVARIGALFAELVFDSQQGLELAGVRTTALDNRQLLYRAGDFSIDLQIAAEGERAGMTGQILREGEMRFESVAGLALQLTAEGRTVFATETNERGEFAIGDVQRGQYDLQIDAGDLSIRIVGLPVS